MNRLVLPRPHELPLLSAHRGASDQAPENTLTAFERAVELGATMIELDVHPTRDGALVVIHDVTTRRTAGHPARLQDLSLDQVQALDAGRWYGPQFAGERIPTLRRVLEWARGRVYLNLDVRNYPFFEFYRAEWMAGTLVALLRETAMADQVIVQCPDHKLAQQVKRRDSQIATGLTVHGRPVDSVALARAADADLLGLDLEFLLESEARRLHAAGIALMVTVDRRLPGLDPVSDDELEAIVSRLTRWSVDILVTDTVDRVHRLLEGAHQTRPEKPA